MAVILIKTIDPLIHIGSGTSDNMFASDVSKPGGLKGLIPSVLNPRGLILPFFHAFQAKLLTKLFSNVQLFFFSFSNE